VHLVVDLAQDGGSFDPTYRTLASGGALVVAAHSFGPNPLKKMHCLATLDTSAVALSLSDMRGKCAATAREGFAAGLLEASHHPDKEWSKIVVSVAPRYSGSES